MPSARPIRLISAKPPGGVAQHGGVEVESVSATVNLAKITAQPIRITAAPIEAPSSL